jgi:sarcosine/dimethylglycine N-methyltransferase
MQSAKCPPDVLKPILDRIHLDSLGSIEYYQQLANDLGFKEVQIVNLSQNLPAHYSRVLQELVAQHHTLIRVCTEEYLASMKVGLQYWIDAGMAGHLTWGILHFQRD